MGDWTLVFNIAATFANGSEPDREQVDLLQHTIESFCKLWGGKFGGGLALVEDDEIDDTDWRAEAERLAELVLDTLEELPHGPDCPAAVAGVDPAMCDCGYEDLSNEALEVKYHDDPARVSLPDPADFDWYRISKAQFSRWTRVPFADVRKALTAYYGEDGAAEAIATLMSDPGTVAAEDGAYDYRSEESLEALAEEFTWWKYVDGVLKSIDYSNLREFLAREMSTDKADRAMRDMMRNKTYFSWAGVRYFAFEA